MARPFDPDELSEEYPHRIRITRAGTPGGTDPGDAEGQDPGTGLPTDPEDAPRPGPESTELVILDRPCDAQDGGEQRPRQAAGMPWLQADATIFVEDDEATVAEFLEVVPGDTFELFYNPRQPDGRGADGEILQTRELDTSMLGKFR
jgi:hypothetical protein